MSSCVSAETKVNHLCLLGSISKTVRIVDRVSGSQQHDCVKLAGIECRDERLHVTVLAAAGVNCLESFTVVAEQRVNRDA